MDGVEEVEDDGEGEDQVGGVRGRGGGYAAPLLL